MEDKRPTLPKAILTAFRKVPRRYQKHERARSHARIATYNVHKCVGLDGRFDPERIAGVIAEIDADIIALQEADQRFGKRAGLLDLARLKSHADLNPVYESERSASHGWHGNVMLVRAGLVRDVNRLDLPGVEPRGALIADLELHGTPLRIIAAHLGLLRHSRALQTAHLLDQSRAKEHPTIIMGDLNEWRVRRRSALNRLTPHFGPVHAALPSFPTRMPFLALDRILANPESLIARIEVHDTPLARIASDHLPLKADLDLSAAVTN